MLRSGRPADDAAAHGVCPVPRVGASCVGVHGPSARADKTLVFTSMGNTFTTTSTSTEVPDAGDGAESVSPNTPTSTDDRQERSSALARRWAHMIVAIELAKSARCVIDRAVLFDLHCTNAE